MEENKTKCSMSSVESQVYILTLILCRGYKLKNDGSGDPKIQTSNSGRFIVIAARPTRLHEYAAKIHDGG